LLTCQKEELLALVRQQAELLGQQTETIDFLHGEIAALKKEIETRKGGEPTALYKSDPPDRVDANIPEAPRAKRPVSASACTKAKLHSNNPEQLPTKSSVQSCPI